MNGTFLALFFGSERRAALKRPRVSSPADCYRLYVFARNLVVNVAKSAHKLALFVVVQGRLTVL